MNVQYQVSVSFDLAKAVGPVGEVVDRVNNLLAAQGIQEKIGARSKAAAFTLSCDRELTRKERKEIMNTLRYSLATYGADLGMQFESLRKKSRNSRSQTQSR